MNTPKSTLTKHIDKIREEFVKDAFKKKDNYDPESIEAYLNDFADRVIGLVDANISAIKDFEKED